MTTFRNHIYIQSRFKQEGKYTGLKEIKKSIYQDKIPLHFLYQLNISTREYSS